MNHFCRAESRFVHREGTRHRTVCAPCSWVSQWHRTKAAANADYQDHCRAQDRAVARLSDTIRNLPQDAETLQCQANLLSETCAPLDMDHPPANDQETA